MNRRSWTTERIVGVLFLTCGLLVTAPNVPALAACAWTIQTPSVGPGFVAGGPGAIAAISPNDVWVVGTGIAHWNGSSWSASASPGVEDLTDVSASGPSDVWAVGGSSTLHYDGASWSEVANPVNSIPGANLLAVDARGSRAIAVGEIISGNTYSTLAMSWNGATWRIQPTPTPNESAVLLDVTRVAWNDVWAVGQYAAAAWPHDSETLVEHFDGATWSVVPSFVSGGGSGSSRLEGVTRVPGSNEIWAVGSWHDPANHDVALTLRWNGVAMQQVPTPPTTFTSVFIRAIGAVSKNQVWAVGEANGRARALMWDGVTWHNMPVPQVQAIGNGVYGVAVVPHTSQLWAMDLSSGSNGYQTAILTRC